MDPNFLEFEQPIAELQAKISELRYVTDDSDINISQEGVIIVIIDFYGNRFVVVVVVVVGSRCRFVRSTLSLSLLHVGCLVAGSGVDISINSRLFIAVLFVLLLFVLFWNDVRVHCVRDSCQTPIRAPSCHPGGTRGPAR